MDTVRLETRFGMADGLTPVLAARIAECASRYDSHVSIESAGRAIRIESLISVLSMELRRGLDVYKRQIHISKLANGRVDKVEDVVKIGDELECKVAEIDAQGRINLIRNDIQYDDESMPVRRPPRRDGDRGGRDRGGRPPRR